MSEQSPNPRDLVLYCTAPFNTAQYSTVQYSTVQYSKCVGSPLTPIPHIITHAVAARCLSHCLLLTQLYPPSSSHPALLTQLCSPSSTHPALLTQLCSPSSTHQALLTQICSHRYINPDLLTQLFSSSSSHQQSVRISYPNILYFQELSDLLDIPYM